ncbi:hypothetical protein [Nocardia lijiangensis]|uniref:hypothetical protein n=1 Tax=Nocardia lijiangensis TaxID=299618 RepID=UPI003D73593C
MRKSIGDIDPITGQLDALRRALLTDRATAGRYGVAVDVLADGTLAEVRISDTVTPYGAELGRLITTLAKEALDQARGTARERIDDLTADPRIAAAVETIELASERPRPIPPPVRQPTGHYDDDLTEEELIEENQRRNQSFFR